jgi:hypothetical protein
MTQLQRLGTLMIAGLLVSAGSIAQEKRIKREDLPAPVAKTVDDQGTNVSIRGFSTEKKKGQTYYEAHLTVSGHNKDILISADGTIVEVEEEVAFDSLPDGVKQALKTKAGNGQIRKVEALTKKQKLVAYEAQIATNGKKSEIQVGPDGGPLAHKE